MTSITNKSSYWACQLIGWAVTGCYWMAGAFLSGRFDWGLAVAYFFPDVLIGIAVTHLYHQLAHRFGWIDLGLPDLLRVTIPAVLISGSVYMALVLIKNYEVRLLFGQPFESSLLQSLQKNWLILLSTGIRLMAIWILAFHLYHYAGLRIRLADERAQLEVAVKQAELQNLSAQLNPHFFFNALNSIKALAATDPERARRAIDLLSSLLQHALKGNHERQVLLAQELELVTDYLELEKIRFEERLRFSIDIPEELLGVQVPSLALQTLVENAVKHGIAMRAEGGWIRVSAERKNAALRIVVQNPGKWVHSDTLSCSGGLNQPGTGGTGLRNLRERLQLEYNGQTELTIQELPGETISTVLVLPIQVDPNQSDPIHLQSPRP